LRVARPLRRDGCTAYNTANKADKFPSSHGRAPGRNAEEQ